VILVCGEALVDLFILDQKGPRLSAEAVAGGSPYNVAIGLARLGCTSAFCGGISRDRFGELLFGQLIEESVSLDHAPRMKELTTISVVATDRDGVPLYSFHGEGAADRSITAADVLKPLGDDVDAITIGSYSLAVEPSGSAYLQLAEREARRRVVSFDPNIRPTVIGDVPAYAGKLARFASTATIVKSSEEDIALVYGKKSSVAEIAASWLKLGPRLVVVTRGAEGAVAFTDGQSVDVPGRRIRVVDTVGAGDSFHAALLAHLSKTGNLARDRIGALGAEAIGETLHYAVAASAITCSRRGADLPRSVDVETFLSAA